MNGIKQSDCKFYVNEEERTVVCVIPNTEGMLEEYILENFGFPEFDFSSYWGKLRRKVKMPHSFMGKAVCSKDDEWNEEVGRLLAFSRAKDKCYKSFFKRANMYVQTIDRRLGDMISMFNDLGLKLETKKETVESKIESLIQKE